MKSILLTSTALVAFAGAAAADGHSSVSFAGEATVGANVTDGVNDVETTRFYWDASLDATLSTALDNGVEASVTFGIDAVDSTNLDADDADSSSLGGAVTTSDFVLNLKGGNTELSLGDIENIAEDGFGDDIDGFNGVDGNASTGFTEADDEAVLGAVTTFAGVTAGVTFDADDNELDDMQLLVRGSFSNVTAELAYEDRGDLDALIGVAASTTFANATITGSYMEDGTETSTGISVSYPYGPVTVGGYYTMNDVAEDNFGVEATYAANNLSLTAEYDVDAGEAGADDVGTYAVYGSYDLGNGLEAFAGVEGSDVDGVDPLYYVAGAYDLGGGSSLLVSYADDGDKTVLGEDLGDPEYDEGLTVEVTFAF